MYPKQYRYHTLILVVSDGFDIAEGKNLKKMDHQERRGESFLDKQDSVRHRNDSHSILAISLF